MRGDAKMRTEVRRRRMEASIGISLGFFFARGYWRFVFLQVQ